MGVCVVCTDCVCTDCMLLCGRAGEDVIVRVEVVSASASSPSLQVFVLLCDGPCL